jgi:Bacterial extracellular solute-binding protein/von Willebrand factor type A domain
VGRHRSKRKSGRARWIAAGAIVVAVAAGAVVVTASQLGSRRSHGGHSSSRSSATTNCPRSVSVVVASGVRPVLDKVVQSVSRTANCVGVQATVADGSDAVTLVEKTRPDVWIADDASWAGLVPAGVLVKAPPTVIATSPVFAVLPRGASLPASATTWDGLSTTLAQRKALRLTLADPAVAGSSMVAAGALTLAVFEKSGPLISALNLMRAWQGGHTAPGPAPAWPSAGQVGLVTEQEVIHAGAAERYTIRALGGPTAVQRVSLSESQAAAKDRTRASSVARLKAALMTPTAVKAFEAAGFRGPGDKAEAPASSSDLPSVALASTFPTTAEHFMFHVLTTWHPERRRANLLVVVDVSGSMADPAPGTKRSLISLVSQGVQQVNSLMPAEARVGLWVFGSRLDAPRDYRMLVPGRPLDAVQRARLNAAARKLKAQQTGTGLYDTILAAYRAQLANFSSDMPTEVMVFTDGRNEDDPGSISLAALRKALSNSDQAKHVQVGVLGFGDRLPVDAFSAALAPIDGQIDTINTAEEVLGAFVHAVSGGLTH